MSSLTLVKNDYYFKTKGEGYLQLHSISVRLFFNHRYRYNNYIIFLNEFL